MAKVQRVLTVHVPLCRFDKLLQQQAVLAAMQLTSAANVPNSECCKLQMHTMPHLQFTQTAVERDVLAQQVSNLVGQLLGLQNSHATVSIKGVLSNQPHLAPCHNNEWQP